jgi:hypothetical protein
MAFIRIVKTASGATAVQIAYKQKGRIIKIIHIKQFVKQLRPIRSGIVIFKGKELLAEAEVLETTLVVLDRLSSGF